MAFASIFVPNFTVQAAARAEPALRERAFAVIEGVPPLCSVTAINEKAALAGVECGMTKAEAEQFAGLEIRPRSRAQEQSAHAALLDIGWSVSPRLEDTSEDTIVLDLSGLTYLFDSKKAIGVRLAQRASECGLCVNVAIAGNAEAALVAARGFTGITVIPGGEESKYLKDLPVSVLLLSEEIAETLNRWGVHTCGALAGLPVLPLSERLGQEGVRLHALAGGKSERPLHIAEPALFFEESMELDDAVEELDSLSFLLGRLLDQLCARLAARALAAVAIHVRFDLEPAFGGGTEIRAEEPCRKLPPGAYERDLRLPVPTRDSKMLLKLLRLRLQSNSPAAPVQKIALMAEATRSRAMQGGLFVPGFPDPEKLELTIARIAHVVGEGNIGSPFVTDTHRPDDFQMRRFAAVEEADCNSGKIFLKNRQADAKVPAGFRVFRPAIPAKLEMRAGRPKRVFFQGARGIVRAASGPWRTSGGWWGEDCWHHDEWDLEIDFDLSSCIGDTAGNFLVANGLYRLYCDALRQRWFVRGIFD